MIITVSDMLTNHRTYVRHPPLRPALLPHSAGWSGCYQLNVIVLSWRQKEDLQHPEPVDSIFDCGHTTDTLLKWMLALHREPSRPMLRWKSHIDSVSSDLHDQLYCEGQPTSGQRHHPLFVRRDPCLQSVHLCQRHVSIICSSQSVQSTHIWW